MRKPSPDEIHETERGALSIAFLNGSKVLTKNGLRARHFQSENGSLFRILETATEASPSGIPELLHVQQMIGQWEDSGLHPGEQGATFARLMEGHGDPLNAQWYAKRIKGAWKARTRHVLAAEYLKTQTGESDRDPSELLRKLEELSQEDEDRPNALEMLDRRAVVLAYPPPQPPDTITIAGQSICTSGNLTVISGQSKSGKSSAIAALLAACLTVNENADCLGFRSAPTDSKAVLLFDSEQSPFDAWAMQSRILRRAGLAEQPGTFQHHYMLDLSIPQRKEAVFASIRRAHKGHGIHLVCIDGVADLTDDVNDPVTSNLLVAELVALAVEVAAPLVLILHENPAPPGGPGKTRGHLGSQLERKAESNLKIVKGADGVSTIFGDRCRRANIPQGKGQRFVWDDELRMHISAEPAAVAKEGKASTKREELLEKLFSAADSAGELQRCQIIKIIVGYERVSESTARNRFDDLVNLDAIRRTPGGRYARNLVHGAPVVQG